MKIQINSLAVMERLIGNDNELELDIRKNIVYAFADKHLKPLSGLIDGMVAETKRQVEAGIKKATAECLKAAGITTTAYGNVSLSEEARTKIRESANAEIRGIVAEMVAKVDLEPFVTGSVERRIDAAVTGKFRAAIRDEIRTVLKEMFFDKA